MEANAGQSGPSDSEKARMHREFLAEGLLTEDMMVGVALEALERADVELFLEVTNITRQSTDPEVLRRTASLLDTYADMAAGTAPQ